MNGKMIHCLAVPNGILFIYIITLIISLPSASPTVIIEGQFLGVNENQKHQQESSRESARGLNMFHVHKSLFSASVASALNAEAISGPRLAGGSLKADSFFFCD